MTNGLTYAEELTKAMTWLGSKDALFLGQGIVYGGHAMFKTLDGVPLNQRIELPVAEEMQMGMSLGLALTGRTVVSIYPRMDFLMCAMNQLVNHVDKLQEFTHGQFKAKVIIRVGIGSTAPLYPGSQHCSDYTEGLSKILQHTRIYRVMIPEDAMPIYRGAYEREGSSLIIEEMDSYATL